MKLTHLEALREDLPPYLRDDDSDGFIGIVFSFMQDVVMHFCTFANRGTLLADPAVADDALPLQGWERGLPRYQSETVSAYADRLQDAWSVWGGRDTDTSFRDRIIEQMEAFGFGAGIAIYDPVQWPAEAPVGYWSQFWITVPYGSHVFSELVWDDAGYWDDVGTWDGSGSYTASEQAQLIALVNRHKPVNWVCREIRFMHFDGTAYETLEITPYVP